MLNRYGKLDAPVVDVALANMPQAMAAAPLDGANPQVGSCSGSGERSSCAKSSFSRGRL